MDKINLWFKEMNLHFRVIPSVVFLLLSVITLLIMQTITPYNNSEVAVEAVAEFESEPVYEPTYNELCQPSEDKNQPYLVTISEIGIENVCIEPIGAEKDGTLGDPDNFMMMGWYKNSVTPLVEGAGLYACHNSFSSNPEKRALCDRLSEITNDGEIIIEVSSGQKFTYDVNKIKTVLLAEVDMAEFQEVSSEGDYGISLMSCAGSWDTKIGDATHRLLVWATRK